MRPPRAVCPESIGETTVNLMGRKNPIHIANDLFSFAHFSADVPWGGTGWELDSKGAGKPLSSFKERGTPNFRNELLRRPLPSVTIPRLTNVTCSSRTQTDEQ